MNRFFESPALLTYLLLVAAIAGLTIADHLRRRRRLGAWPGVLRESDRQRAGWRQRLGVRAAGLACLVIAIAGPIGGTSTAETITGRDVMIVLDVSRSMSAEQPSRLTKAVRTLRSLTEPRRLPPGSRVGLTVFAAQPWLAFPLTSDLDHFAFTLDQLDSGDIPRQARGEPGTIISGTRLGAALKSAVENFPEHGSRDIVLVSDGDDPVSDDEWLMGVAAASAKGATIHVVAVGEPGLLATIPAGDNVLRHEGNVVKTQVQTSRLRDIATRGGGLFIALDQGVAPLASPLADFWSRSSAIQRDVASSARGTIRTPWLILALIFFWLDVMGPPRRFETRNASHGLVAASALILVSGETVSDAFRRGQDAFAQREYAAAVDWFNRAQPLADDPGLIAFNRAAAHYRLGNYSEAVRDYRAALDDDAIPAERRTRAWFDLGNALLAQAGDSDRRKIEQSMFAFRVCLTLRPGKALRHDAEHNLEIAGRRWLKAKPPSPQGNGPDHQPDSKPTGPSGNDPKKDGPLSKSPDTGKPGKGAGDGKNSGSKKPALGQITVLPDQATPISLTPSQLAATLADQAERIAHERRRERIARDIVPPTGKDW